MTDPLSLEREIFVRNTNSLLMLGGLNKIGGLVIRGGNNYGWEIQTVSPDPGPKTILRLPVSFYRRGIPHGAKNTISPVISMSSSRIVEVARVDDDEFLPDLYTQDIYFNAASRKGKIHVLNGQMGDGFKIEDGFPDYCDLEKQTQALRHMNTLVSTLCTFWGTAIVNA
jgi:hypothetical protein